MMQRAHFTLEVVHGLGAIVVQDKDGPVSVTNDAESVVADIVSFLGPVVDLGKFRIVYCDSDGRWDGIVVKDGKFAGFLILAAQSVNAAVARWDRAIIPI